MPAFIQGKLLRCLAKEDPKIAHRRNNILLVTILDEKVTSVFIKRWFAKDHPLFNTKELVKELIDTLLDNPPTAVRDFTKDVFSLALACAYVEKHGSIPDRKNHWFKTALASYVEDQWLGLREGNLTFYRRAARTWPYSSWVSDKALWGAAKKFSTLERSQFQDLVDSQGILVTHRPRFYRWSSPMIRRYLRASTPEECRRSDQAAALHLYDHLSR